MDKNIEAITAHVNELMSKGFKPEILGVGKVVLAPFTMDVPGPKYFNNAEDSDILLVLRPTGQRFHVHKSVLVPQSTFFEGALSSSFQEASESVVTLVDVPRADLVEDVLRFMYMGSFSNTHDYDMRHVIFKGKNGEIVTVAESLPDPSRLVGLVRNADYFGVPGLIDACGDIMIEFYRRSSYINLIHDTDFGKIPSSLIERVLQNGTLSVHTRIRTVLRWCENACSQEIDKIRVSVRALAMKLTMQEALELCDLHTEPFEIVIGAFTLARVVIKETGKRKEAPL